MSVVLLVLVAAIVATGVLVARSTHTGRSPRVGVVLSLGLALASLFTLWPTADTELQPWHWIPALDPVGLHISVPANWLVVQVLILLCLSQFLLMGAASTGEDQVRWWPWAYLLGALVVVALTVDQFLARIVALDLISVLTIALSSQSEQGLVRRYLTLRVGDLALLAMVLGLWNVIGTLNIDSLLRQAALLRGTEVSLLLGAGVLAAWVKLGLPPFGGWLTEALRSPRPARVLISSAGLPLLGAYLLYRLNPVLVAQGWVWPLRGLGLLAILWSASQAMRWRIGRDRFWLSVQGALMLLLVGSSLLRACLLLFVPLRVALLLVAQPATSTVKPRVGVPRLAPCFTWLSCVPLCAAWAERCLSAASSWCAEGLLALALACERWLERGLLGGLVSGVHRVARGLSRSLSERHTGRLRRNLAWTTAALGILLVAAMLAL